MSASDDRCFDCGETTQTIALNLGSPNDSSGKNVIYICGKCAYARQYEIEDCIYHERDMPRNRSNNETK